MANKYSLDLDRAWGRVLSEVKRDEIPDLLRWQDYALSWPAWRAETEGQLNEDLYLPQVPRIVEMAKDSFVTRPMAQLRPADRVVYEAIIDEIAPPVDAVLPPCVFSARLRQSAKGGFRIRPQMDDWKKFQAAALELHYLNPFGCMLTTDVSSYFEYVDIAILIEDLKDPALNLKPELLNLLSSFLNTVQRSSDVWGLPQGPGGSSILGNFYMLPVDALLLTLPVKHVRYQDDVRIFADSPDQLRLALQQVIRTLRNRHLNVSPSKTRIFEGPAIAEELEDLEKDSITYILKAGSTTTPSNSAGPTTTLSTSAGTKLVRRQLRGMFDGAVASVPYDVRSIRFSIYRLAQLGDDYAVAWTLDHLPEVPFLATHLVEYLGAFMSHRSDIESSVREYLKDSSKNIYPFAELHLLRLLAKAERIENETHALVWQILKDQNRERFVREHAARCIGKHKRPGSGALLKAEFNNISEKSIQRALLVAHVEAKGIDKAWLGAVSKSDAELRHTCKYLLSGTALPIP